MMKQALKLVFTFFTLLFATALFSQVDVLTQHNNVSRTGWNNTETQLTKANVGQAGSFGLLTSHNVDDQIYSQPLVVSGVDINGTPTNVVYVETVNNTIYAYNAENGTAPVIWQRNLTNTGYRPPYNTDMTTACGGGYKDYSPMPGYSTHGQIGIVGTPVIDKPSNTMWFVHREVDPGQIDAGPHPGNDGAYLPTGFRQFLHAVDIRTGAEKANSPVLITATAAGSGPGSSGNILSFDPRKENQRGGLLLMNGAIYIPYAAHCDWDNYYGWVLAYDATSLQQRTAWVTGPNDSRGGIWMSGSAITADPAANGGNGSLYLASGNSYNGDPMVLENRGESVIRLDPNGQGASLTKLNIGDYFTPTDYDNLNAYDLDFSTQTMLLPNSNLLVAGCKDFNLYVFNKANLGKYNAGGNQNLQKLFVAMNAQMHTAFAYFGGATHQYFYQFSENTNLKAYPVTTNALGTTPVDGVGQGPDGAAGSVMSVSSNGTDESTGILWISQAKPGCNANQQGCPGILRAVDAVNVGTELWNSSKLATDEIGFFSKNSCPTVANGKVYLPSFSNKLNIYGILDNNPLCKTNVALARTYTESGGNTANAGNAFDGNTGTSWIQNTAAAWVQVDLGAAYDICKIAVNWSGADDAGQAFSLQVSNNPAGPWTTIETVTGNTAITTDYTGTYPSSRYVRLQGVTMGTNGDYQLAELQVLGTLSATCTPPTNVVAGNITQTGATITWDPVATANSYILKYRTPAVTSWLTRTPTNTTQAISQLSCGFDYTIDLQSVCATDTSAVKEITMSTSVCAIPCNLPTRYNHADLGDVGAGGSSCFDAPTTTFTIQGSGDIGGNDDIFQYAYTNLAGDETYEIRMMTLTNLAGAKGGIMMRDSMTNTSKFVFLGLNQGSGIQFMYRTASGGATTTIQGPTVTLPYYLRVVKTGTIYAAFTSANGTAWTQFASQNTGFGTGTVYPGLGVSSAVNTQLATGTFAQFSESSPLPITLANFTGKNVDNKYIALSWSTLNEQNNDHFILQHSPDGETFTTLTTVKAAGDSDTLRNYSAVDNTPYNGTNYYRLVQVDLDARETILPVIVVNFGSGTSPVVYPNPVNDYVNIVGGDEPILKAVLYDITGRKIRQAINTAGTSTLQIPTAGLPKGVYMLKTITTTKTYQQSIIKP